MRRIEIDPDRIYLCKILNEQLEIKEASCGLKISSSGIDLSVVSFTDRPFISSGALWIKSEGGWIASLFDNVDAGHRSVGIDNPVTTSSLSSNTAIIGYTRWYETDQVYRAMLRFPSLDYLLSDSEVASRLLNSDFFDEVDDQLIKVDLDDYWLEVSYYRKGSFDTKRTTAVTPVLTLHFRKGTSITLLRQAIIAIERFFTCMTGTLHQCAAVNISQITEEDFLERVKNRQKTDDFELHYFRGQRNATTKKKSHSFFDLPVLVIDDAHCADFAAWIKKWLTTYDALSMGAYLMEECIIEESTLSPNRLLTATRCFESLPSTKARILLSDLEAKKIADAVSEAMHSLGHTTPYAERVVGAVRRVTEETNRDRFSRIVGDLCASYESQIVGGDMVDWLCEAFRARGSLAHGGASGFDQASFGRRSRTIMAIEAVNVLLLFKDFPSSDRKRLGEHKIVSYYQHSVRDRLPGKE